MPLEIAHIEVTQAIQTHTNSVALTTRKPTVVRVFPSFAGDPQPDRPEVQVSGSLQAKNQTGASIDPENGPITMGDSCYRGNLEDSLNFLLEPEWCEGNVEIEIDVWVEKPNKSSKLRQTIQLRFEPSKEFNIRFVSVTTPDSPNPQKRVMEQEAANYLRALFPGDPTKVTYEPWSDEPLECETPNGEIDGNALILRLSRIFITDPFSDKLYAWTPAGSFPRNGRSHPRYYGGDGLVAFGNVDSEKTDLEEGRYRRTFAHEFGHNAGENGLVHPSTNPNSPNYYRHELINGEFGFDVMKVDPHARGVMCFTPDKRPLVDVMVPGRTEQEAWIGSHNYSALQKIAAETDENETITSVSEESNEGTVEVRLINGIVRRDGDIDANPPFTVLVERGKLDQILAINDQPGTRFEIRFYEPGKRNDVAGLRIQWEPTFTNARGQAVDETWFQWLIPEHKLKSISRIVFFHDGEPIDRIALSREIVDPKDYELEEIYYDSENRKLKWKMPKKFPDIGNDQFVIDVYATFNHPTKHRAWQLILSTEEPKHLSHESEGTIGVLVPDWIDVDRLGAIQVRISHKAVAKILPALTAQTDVKARSTCARIINPPDNKEFLAGESVLLLGYGIRDGARTEDITWTVSRSGEEVDRRTGTQAVLRKLEPGEYSVTVVVATSEYGKTDMATHRFTVVPKNNSFDATLS